MVIGGWYRPAEPADIFASMLPRPLPDLEESRLLNQLPERLSQAGYEENELERLLGDLPLIARRYEQTPGYVYRCRRAGDTQADLAMLWLLRQPLSRQATDQALGRDLTDLLLKYQMLEEQSGEVRARADLYPCMGRCFFTDPKWSIYQRLPNHVYDVSGDSYGLAFLIDRPKLTRALDLGLGSGIHAILAAGHAQSVTGVDVNPRAIYFTSFNARINGVADRCDFRHGSLLGPVQGERFDQITANLPFVPTPKDETLELYRPGGETGEELIEEVVSQLKHHLNPGGTLYLVVTYPIMRDSHYLDRLQKWLGGPRGWGLGLVNYGLLTRELYIEMQIEDFDGKVASPEFMERFTRWIDCYEKHGIEAIREGVVAIRRLVDDHPGFREEIHVPLPKVPVGELTGAWLANLERFSHPDWRPEEGWTPRLHPQVKRLWRDIRGGAGRAEFHHSGWWRDRELTPDEAAAAQAVAEGGTTEPALLAALGRKLVLC